VQVFLQGKVRGIEAFLLASGTPAEEFAGRALYCSLIAELIPRALLRTQGVALEALGACAGGDFLVVLPAEAVPTSETWLGEVRRRLEALGRGELTLVWGATENLGDWSDVRKRLQESRAASNMPSAEALAAAFTPAEPSSKDEEAQFFAGLFGGIRDAARVAWLAESPYLLALGGGELSWDLKQDNAADALPLVCHLALDDAEERPATPVDLAARATGAGAWGVLRGDVDNYGIRLRRAQNIEEHIQLSVFYKQFFAGEMQFACAMPEFWRKISVLYSGGDDFAVFGCWDALIPFAREMQRLFHRFADEFLKDYAGPEGKTISMAITLAANPGDSLVSVYAEAGRQLEIAKNSGKDAVYLLGRLLE
jgi:CRISPR-associated protein Csm1